MEATTTSELRGDTVVTSGRWAVVSAECVMGVSISGRPEVVPEVLQLVRQRFPGHRPPQRPGVGEVRQAVAPPSRQRVPKPPSGRRLISPQPRQHPGKRAKSGP